MVIIKDLRERRRLKEKLSKLTSQHMLLYTYLEKYPGDKKRQKEIESIRKQMNTIKAILR